jgi:hypothetical protein
MALFTEEAREERVLLCRTPLQVQRIAWEALTPGVEAGEQPMPRETMLHVIAPDVRDLRTELQRLGSTARDLAYDDGGDATPGNRLLDGARPAIQSTTRSPIMRTVAWVPPDLGMRGITDASTTHNPWTPLTLQY